MSETPLDSKEGIEHLFRWAKWHNVVLELHHEKIAQKWGVSTEGVVINRRLPAYTSKS